MPPVLLLIPEFTLRPPVMVVPACSVAPPETFIPPKTSSFAVGLVLPIPTLCVCVLRMTDVPLTFQPETFSSLLSAAIVTVLPLLESEIPSPLEKIIVSSFESAEKVVEPTRTFLKMFCPEPGSELLSVIS